MILLTILFITGCSSTIKPIPYKNRYLVAVGDIQNQTGDTNYDPILEPLTGNFISELQKTDCFRLVERQRLKSMLDEHKLGMSGLTDPGRSKEVGKLLGVDAILFISLSSVNYQNQLNKVGQGIENGNETINVNTDARLVAAETGEIYASTSHSEKVNNTYSRVGSIKNGEKIDMKLAVQKAFEQSAEIMARDISSQVSKNQ
jgi:curli biogenesis system outer membrane secretion channel CsgG